MRKVKRSKTFGRGKRIRSTGGWRISKFEIAKLELHDGDMIVLRTDLMLTPDQSQALFDRAKAQFPGIKVAVLTCGISLAVLADKRTDCAA